MQTPNPTGLSLRESFSKADFISLAAIAVIVLLGSCSKEPPAPTKTEIAEPEVKVDSEIVASLRSKCIPFRTSKPESGLEDFASLTEMVGSARVVALGEPIHGTKALFEMKHRLLKYLFKEMGFNIFAIEATWPESNLVNDYVQTGTGDPARLLARLYFWIWSTQEVLDMILWMRRHDQNPANAPRVSFFGFDMQYPRIAMDSVIVYLQKVDCSAAKWADSHTLSSYCWFAEGHCCRNEIGGNTSCKKPKYVSLPSSHSQSLVRSLFRASQTQTLQPLTQSCTSMRLS